MNTCKLSYLASVSLVASILLGFGPLDAAAQALSQQVRSDRAIALDGVIGEETTTRDSKLRGMGKVFFPGDHFTRAFPGDHFTLRQRAMLEGQGIRSVADFIAADAAVIARLVGAQPMSVNKWQTDIKRGLR